MTAEEEVLDLLLENARHSTADLARMVDRSEDEVEAAIDRLEAEGVVRGYRPVVDWGRADREHVRAMVEVDVTPDRETGYEDVARRLARFPEVTSLRLVAGDHDFAMEVGADTMRGVSEFVSEKVATLPEVDGTITHMVMESFKEGGIEMADDDDDDRLSVSP
jgi:DNA-binding Lrp family transcriptional regulator